MLFRFCNVRCSFFRPLFLSLISFLTGCAPDVGVKPQPHVTTVRSQDFSRSLGNILGAGFVAGNEVKTLENGDAIFPAMLSAIRNARRTIAFETYVFEKGIIPQQFANALSERARAGVKVLVIVDAQGGSKGKPLYKDLEKAGAHVVRYNRAWIPNLLRYNNRTHRKLLIVDGETAYIGGVGISDKWAGNARSAEEWRDNHYRVRGPAVAQAQAAFADNWLQARKEILFGPNYFPVSQHRGDVAGNVFFASPRHGSFGVSVLHHMAISAAQKSILIQNAYFVPDNDTVAALSQAAKRGVRVRIILPGDKIDQPKVRRASRKVWKTLLESGVELYEYQPTMIHSKMLIVDGYFVSIGSANFDNRSLHLNDEANLNTLSAKFAAEQTRIFEKDLAQSRRITLENYQDIPVSEKILGVLQSPIEGQL